MSLPTSCPRDAIRQTLRLLATVIRLDGGRLRDLVVRHLDDQVRVRRAEGRITDDTGGDLLVIVDGNDAPPLCSWGTHVVWIENRAERWRNTCLRPTGHEMYGSTDSEKAARNAVHMANQGFETIGRRPQGTDALLPTGRRT